jgi:hypothetical protein
MDLMLWKGTPYQGIDKSPTRIKMILVFRCQRQVLCDEPMLIDQPSIGSEDIDGLLKISPFF